MRSTLLGSVAAAVLVLSVSSCGGGSDMSATDPRTSAEPTVEPSMDPSAGTTTPPSEGLQKVRVVGQVVEDGDCVVVRDDNQITWTIAGDLAADLVLHDRVQVTGAPDLRATGCGGSVVTATSVRVLPPVE
jgi:hypothetical protein